MKYSLDILYWNVIETLLDKGEAFSIRYKKQPTLVGWAILETFLNSELEMIVLK